MTWIVALLIILLIMTLFVFGATILAGLKGIGQKESAATYSGDMMASSELSTILNEKIDNKKIVKDAIFESLDPYLLQKADGTYYVSNEYFPNGVSRLESASAKSRLDFLMKSTENGRKPLTKDQANDIIKKETDLANSITPVLTQKCNAGFILKVPQGLIYKQGTVVKSTAISSGFSLDALIISTNTGKNVRLDVDQVFSDKLNQAYSSTYIKNFGQPWADSAREILLYKGLSIEIKYRRVINC